VTVDSRRRRCRHETFPQITVGLLKRASAGTSRRRGRHKRAMFRFKTLVRCSLLYYIRVAMISLSLLVVCIVAVTLSLFVGCLLTCGIRVRRDSSYYYYYNNNNNNDNRRHNILLHFILVSPLLDDDYE